MSKVHLEDTLAAIVRSPLRGAKVTAAPVIIIVVAEIIAVEPQGIIAISTIVNHEIIEIPNHARYVNTPRINVILVKQENHEKCVNNVVSASIITINHVNANNVSIVSIVTTLIIMQLRRNKKRVNIKHAIHRRMKQIRSIHSPRLQAICHK